MRLPSGVLWPIPVNLDVTEKFADEVKAGDTIALRDAEGVLIATLAISDLWRPDRTAEARGRLRHHRPAAPGRRLSHPARATRCISAASCAAWRRPPITISGVLRHSPAELRALFRKLGWRKVVAFQTRNPLHRAHQELTFRAAKEHEANLLIHPVVGLTKPGDVDHYTRVRCYEAVLSEYPEQTTALSLLNLAMRMGGPREAVWHAIIRKNYGCTHFIVGRDHAGPGNDSRGKPFYGPYDAQELMKEHEHELDITMVPFQEMVYVEELGAVRSRQRDAAGPEDPEHLRHGVPAPPAGRPRDPGLVLLPERGGGAAQGLPAAARSRGSRCSSPGFSGTRQVDHRQCADGEAPGDRHPPDHAARRRPRAQAPVERARLLQGTPRPEHPAHRLRRVRDHEERRRRDLRADRPIRRDAPARCAS